MTSDIMNFEMEKTSGTIIKVIGVGGGGSNAVNHMFRQGIKDVGFMVCNTDAQALQDSPVPVRVQLGASLTEGRGAGNKPEIGREAAIENISDVKNSIEPTTKMVFITAGMGGGTGTGAAPVIAEASRDMGILTIGIVTLPFRNEGRRRVKQALEGIAAMEGYVDSLLVINNEKIREIYGDCKISEAFAKADNVLATAAKGIAEIITVPGYVNVDFADVETVMRKSGVALMGSAKAKGKDRALHAVEAALNSPLLNNNDIKGAKDILLNITSGVEEITMDEIGLVTDYIQAKAGHDADLIWGNGIDANLDDEISVTVIATGFSVSNIPEMIAANPPVKTYHSLDEERIAKQEARNAAGYTVASAAVTSAASSAGTPSTPVVTPNASTVAASAASPADNAKPFSQDPARTRVSHDDAATQKDVPLEVSSSLAEQFDDIYGKKNDTPEKDINLRRDFFELDDNMVEQLENRPAYIRKKINISRPGPDTGKHKLSRFSLSQDDDEKAMLRDNNSYLHDNVD